jgi:hypothetical protein
MSDPNQPLNIQDLFGAAQDDGILGMAAAQVLSVGDIGQSIQNALGIPADSVQAGEVLCIVLDVDDSSSIEFGKNTQHVIDGHNQILEALQATKQKDGILVCTRAFNAGVLSDFKPIDQAVRLTPANFRPYGGTPLYRRMVEGCGLLLAKSTEFAQNGVPVRGNYWVITDGENQSNDPARAQDAAAVVADLLRAENYIIGAVGIQLGQTDFRTIFRECGVPDRWVLTPQATPHDIRQAFQTVSQSAVRASQGALAFSQMAGGGFAQP